MSYETISQLVLTFFMGDARKTKLWFETRNPLLGNISPDEMMKAGREDKLLQWVKERLEENKSPEVSREELKGNPFSWSSCGHPTLPTQCHICQIHKLNAEIAKLSIEKRDLRMSYDSQLMDGLEFEKRYRDYLFHVIKCPISKQAIKKDTDPAALACKECVEINDILGAYGLLE